MQINFRGNSLKINVAHRILNQYPNPSKYEVKLFLNYFKSLFNFIGLMIYNDQSTIKVVNGQSNVKATSRKERKVNLPFNE